MDPKQTVKVLDACEQWADLETIVGASGVLDLSHADLAALVASEQLVEHEGRWLRDRRTMVATRMNACGIAAKDGAKFESFADELVTPRDLDALVKDGHLVCRESKSGPAYGVSLESEGRLWTVGMRLDILAKLPPAVPPAKLEPTQAEVLERVAVEGDWIATANLQEAVNAARNDADVMNKGPGGVEHLAEGPLTEALTALFNAGLVEMRDAGNGERSWRENRDRVIARRAQLLSSLQLSVDDGLLDTEIGPFIGCSEALALAEIAFLGEAGLVDREPAPSPEIGEDGVRRARRVRLRAGADRRAAAWDFIAAEITHGRREAAAVVEPGAGKALIDEVAMWRGKFEAEKRRANDLESWIGRKGFSAQDALDEVRGVTVVARPKREEFTFTEARVVNDAEKGIILGEIIELDQQIAAIRGELEVLTGEHKTRIKELTKKIEGLKSDAACNRRTVEWAAYKVTDWKSGMVRMYRAADDRFLTEEPIPRGAQRTIETEAEKDADTSLALSIDGGKTWDEVQPADQIAVTKEGAEAVVDAASDDEPQEPGPLSLPADEVPDEPEAAPAPKKRGGRKAKSAEASAT